MKASATLFNLPSILAVDFKGDGIYSHIYGLKTDWSLRSKAIELLNSAVRPESYRSYLSFRAGT